MNQHADTLRKYGITRLARIDGIDRIGIPVYSATCPNYDTPITVFSGKGVTKNIARITAIMEAIERTTAVWSNRSIKDAEIARYEFPHTGEKFWLPTHFTELSDPEIDPKDILWTTAIDIDGKEYHIPAQLAYPDVPSELGPRPFRTVSSNGLAAHPSKLLARVNSLLELVERHVVSSVELRNSHMDFIRLQGLAERFGIDPHLSEIFIDRNDDVVGINPDSLPTTATQLYSQYVASGLHPRIYRLDNEFDIPVYAASLVEEINPSEFLACCGYGAALDAAEALERSLLELAQTRVTDMHGSREDRVEPEKSRLQVQPRGHWALSDVRLNSFSPNSNMLLKTDPAYLQELVSRLASKGFVRVAWHEYRTKDENYCVRAIVPGLETWHVLAGEANTRLMSVSS